VCACVCLGLRALISELQLLALIALLFSIAPARQGWAKGITAVGSTANVLPVQFPDLQAYGSIAPK
jgi:hypothetical protein